jgi:hypothetical protein
MNHKEMLNDWSININDITLTVFRVQAKGTHLFLCESKNMFQNHIPTMIFSQRFGHRTVIKDKSILVSTHKKTSMIHKMLDKEQEY